MKSFLTAKTLRNHSERSPIVRGADPCDRGRRPVNPTSLSEARLQCHQWICLAEALSEGVMPERCRVGPLEVGKEAQQAQNDIAHKLDPKGLNERGADFVNAFSSGVENPMT